MSVLLISFLISVVFLLIPENCFAWGPATHIYFGVELLKDVSVLTPVLASILAKFPYDFLYGCISADITLGKKYIEYRHHCHNWRIALRILAEADSTAQKSFAFGYLSHLAADTVAHNFFVPKQMITSCTRNTPGHSYWEICADSLIGRDYWNEVNKISKQVQKTHDRLIRNVVERTLLPFDLNKGIFNGILMIQGLEHWGRIVRTITSRSRWKMGQDEMMKYHRLSYLSILDVLISFDHAECMRLDPTGRRNLRTAKTIRKSLKRLSRRHVLSESAYQTAVKQLPIQAPPFE